MKGLMLLDILLKLRMKDFLKSYNSFNLELEITVIFNDNDLFMSKFQCHRGYTLASDESNGLMSLNPLYIRNVADTKGRYCGQSGGECNLIFKIVHHEIYL